MQLLEVQTFEAGPAQGDLRTSSTTLRVGSNGVLALTKNPDLTIDVEGEHVSYQLYPANVARVRALPAPLTAPTPPKEEPAREATPTDQCAVAQPAVHETVNFGDASSTLACAAADAAAPNTGADEAPETSLADIEKSARKRRSNRK